MARSLYIVIGVVIVCALCGYTPNRLVLDVLTLGKACWSCLISGEATSLMPHGDDFVANVLNATSDCEQLAGFLKEFFRQPNGVDPAAEILFRDFIQQKAARRHTALESTLDWVLYIYKVALPFLICYIVMRVFGSKSSSGSESDHDLGTELSHPELSRRKSSLHERRSMASYEPAPSNTSDWASTSLRPPESSFRGSYA